MLYTIRDMARIIDCTIYKIYYSINRLLENEDNSKHIFKENNRWVADKKGLELIRKETKKRRHIRTTEVRERYIKNCDICGLELYDLGEMQQRCGNCDIYYYKGHRIEYTINGTIGFISTM